LPIPLTKERLEQLVARSTDIVVATDRKGIVIYYNDGAKTSLGYSEAEVLGAFVGKLYPSLEEAKRVAAAMRSPDYGGKGIVETFRTTFLSKAGEEIPVAISGAILIDEHGEEDGTVGFAKDLREILHREELAALGEVAIGLSHEINNPLAVMLNQMELLERDICELAGERDVSVEMERLDAVRREISRVAEILARLGEMVREETYETVDYIGPARMIDLRARRSHERKPDPRLAGLRILIADDDLGIARSLKEILEADGCRVVTASDGLEALEKLTTQPFDLLLSDVVMPNMDGHQLFLKVRESLPDLPVLMMTAFHYDKDHIIKRSRLEGLSGVIFKKPVDPARLLETLHETIEASRGRG
jgi:PAS domain S-box-containing protein